MARFCRQYNRDALKISQATMRLLQDYSWPGNVRSSRHDSGRWSPDEALVHQRSPSGREAVGPKAREHSAARAVGRTTDDGRHLHPEAEMGLKDIGPPGGHGGERR